MINKEYYTTKGFELYAVMTPSDKYTQGIDVKVSEGNKVLAGQTLAIFTPFSSLSVSEKIIKGPKRLLSRIQASVEDELFES